MKLFCASGSLNPTPPFDFDKTLDFLGMFRPIGGEQTLSPQSVTKTLAYNGAAIVFQLTSRGTVEKPQLEYTLYSANKLTPADESHIITQISFFLSLDDDLRPFYAIAQQDEKFAPIVEHFYGLHHVKFLSPFENAVWAILSQRTPRTTAQKVKDALTAQYGPNLTVNGNTYHAFPEPAALFPIPAGELNLLVRNERKTVYLRAVIDAFNSITNDFLYTAPTPELRAWLMKIKGIGEWSADFILLRGLGRTEEMHYDTNSLGTLATAKAMSKVYSPTKQLTPAEMTRLAARYGDLQGYWSYYLRVNA